MDFLFSKSYLSTYYSDENIGYKEVRLYHVYKDNTLLGKYFRHGAQQFFTCLNTRIKIKSVKKVFKKTHFQITNEETSQVLGEFIVTYPYNNTFYHYPEVPYTNPYLKVILFNEEYEFRRARPGTEYRLRDTSTWGHYQFGWYDKQNICVVNYTFKIENPLLDGSIIFNDILDGCAYTEEGNQLLLFAGFFLLEMFFDGQARIG